MSEKARNGRHGQSGNVPLGRDPAREEAEVDAIAGHIDRGTAQPLRRIQLLVPGRSRVLDSEDDVPNRARFV